MKKAMVCRILAVCALGMLLLPGAWGQAGNQGSVSGTVVDQKGGSVSGAAVSLKNNATGAAYETTADPDGAFVFPIVAVGTYELTAKRDGFNTVVWKKVEVSVGGRVNLTVTLTVATQAAVVEVTEEAPLVETTRTQVSSTVDSQAVNNLPVLGRNFINFALLTPGVTLDRRDGDISFAGQRGTLNSLVVDGADNNNTFFGQTTGRTGSGRAPYQFSQDAVAEFQVNSNSYSAEFGHAGGAVINVITKSGTNTLHGSAFEFYRDTALNAQDSITKSLGRAKSPLHFHQFGGSLGGPIVKEKAFFFFDFDGQRNKLPNTVFLGLPATFTLSTDPATAAYQQTALDYLNARAGSWTRTQDLNVILGKVDWNIATNHHLTGRINSARFTGNNFENGGAQNSVEHTGASLVTTDTLSFRFTSTFSPKLTNVAGFTYLRDNEPGEANSVNPEATVRESGNTILTVGRNFFSPRYTNIKRYQWSDTVALVLGKHALKFGGDMMRDRIGNFFPGNFSGSYTFNNLAAFGMSLSGVTPPSGSATYLQAFGGTNTTGPLTTPNLFDSGAFLQDEWRLRKNLTLNVGVRYDVQRVDQPSSAANRAALAKGINTSYIHNPANGAEPRVGIAWTPLSNDRLVVRGGYGIFYGRTPSIMYGTAMSNNGLNVATYTYSPTSTPAMPNYPDNMCGAPDPSGASPSCAAPTGGTAGTPIIFTVDPFYKQPMVQQWSLGTEYELVRNFSVSVTLLGVRGTHLQRTRDINLGALSAATAQIYGTTDVIPYLRYSTTRPIAGFGRILQFEGSAWSSYKGLALQATKRFSKGYQFSVAYTLSRVVDTNPDATAVVPGSSDDGKMVAYPTTPNTDYGNGQNDQRHRFVVSGIWDLDTYTKGYSTNMRRLIGGWELSGILTAQSGQPYTAGVSADINRDGNSRSDRSPLLGRDTFNLPRNISFDPRITKNIAVNERMKFQLLLEAFNVFNKNNVYAVFTGQYSQFTPTVADPCGLAAPLAPAPTICLKPATNFGRQTTTTNTPISPRIVQLGLKFIF